MTNQSAGGWIERIGAAAVTMATVFVLVGAASTELAAQSSRPETREQLRAELQRLEQVVARGDDSDARRSARQRISTIRTRLTEGDFDPGDVVRLYVQSDTALTGDFRVNADRELDFRTIENADLDGVLYAEADSVIREHLGKFLKDTRIRVDITRRIAVLGAVQQPGYYDLRPGTTLSEAIMEAGGPTGQAKLGEVEVRRDGRNLLADRRPRLQQITLAQLGPGADDELYVPGEGSGFSFMGVLGVVSGVAGTAFAISRIF